MSLGACLSMCVWGDHKRLEDEDGGMRMVDEEVVGERGL